ncbi:hypothetical protein A0H81_06988 [Grifola frondosa]|uniref:Uncharacterized protein n=1 Tax=Grifola frondosa TaxID=5627 RepID=A0A1C7M9C8_GRIFR|nr:hypothetical protein A0H81_06988 [Grifola frondosa]
MSIIPAMNIIDEYLTTVSLDLTNKLFISEQIMHNKFKHTYATAFTKDPDTEIEEVSMIISTNWSKLGLVQNSDVLAVVSKPEEPEINGENKDLPAGWNVIVIV